MRKLSPFVMRVAIPALATLSVSCRSTDAPSSGTSQSLNSADLATTGLPVELRVVRDAESEPGVSFETFTWLGEELELGPPEHFTMTLAERGSSTLGEPMAEVEVLAEERGRYDTYIRQLAGRRVAWVSEGTVLMLGGNRGVPDAPRQFVRDDGAQVTPELESLIDAVNGRR